MSPGQRTSPNRRRLAALGGLVAAVTFGAALMGCSDDGGTEQTVTTPSIDLAAVERDVQCELAKSYVSLESTRGAVGDGADPATAQNFENRRVEALERVLRTFKGEVPAEVLTASDQLKLLPLTAERTADSMTKLATSLKQFTDYFDPKCDTEGGRDRGSGPTTTLPLTGSGSTTTAPAGVTGSTDTTTATTAAPTSSSTG